MRRVIEMVKKEGFVGPPLVPIAEERKIKSKKRKGKRFLGMGAFGILSP